MTYKENKEQVRDFVIEWQADFCNHNYSFGELQFFQDIFERLGRRWGLLKEFRENGII